MKICGVDTTTAVDTHTHNTARTALISVRFHARKCKQF